MFACVLLWQKNSSHSSSSSIELFADVSNKALRRHPPTVSPVNVTDVSKKKRNCRKPLQPNRKCLGRQQQQQQTRKLPSFSEFDDYSLIISGEDNAVGSSSGRGHLDSDVGGDRQHLKEDCSKKPSGNCSTDKPSQAAYDAVRCLQYSGVCCNSSVSLRTSSQRCTGRAAAGLATSTPHHESLVRMPSLTMFDDLSQCTSQLQLSDVSNNADIGGYYLPVFSSNALSVQHPRPQRGLVLLTVAMFHYSIGNWRRRYNIAALPRSLWKNGTYSCLRLRERL